MLKQHCILDDPLIHSAFFSSSLLIPHGLDMAEIIDVSKWSHIIDGLAGKEPPEVFYKFFPIEPWLPDLLSGKSLLFSSRTSFNDPFDCRPVFSFRAGNEAVKFFQTALRRHGLSPAKSLIAAKQAIRKANANVDLMAEHTRQLLDNVGVLCLASTWDNALMWSHYAKFHKGISIGFHSDVDVFRIAQPVLYTDDLPTIFVPVNEDPNLFFDTFQKKASCWGYENEWRVVKPNLDERQQDEQFRSNVCFTSVAEARNLSDQRGPGIYSFAKSAIESITLGMRVSKEDERNVKQLVIEAGLKIPIYKIDPPSDTYLLKRTLAVGTR
jgi:hypothetical protein